MNAHTRVQRLRQIEKLFATAGTLLIVLMTVPAQGIELSAQEQRGKRIYVDGESASGAPMTALIAKGTTPIPTSIVTCAGCHGEDGRGRPEGGVVPSDITWRTLTSSYGHDHSYGRSHPAFDDASLARAITTGVDSAGNRLDPAMPRYSIPESDLADLVAYIKRIETDLDTGLTDTEIRIGTLLPLKGPLESLGQAMKTVLEAYFADINSRGGINGRKINLVVGEYIADPTYGSWNARDLLQQQSVFALVSGYVAGIEKEVATLVEETEVPMVGPFTMLPQEDAGLNRFSFYLLSGIKHQGQLLATYACSEQNLKGSRAAIIHPAGVPYEELSAAVQTQAEASGLEQISTVAYQRADFDAVETVRALHEAAVQALFFFGTGEELKLLTTEAQRVDWAPFLFVPGALASKTIFDLPGSFAGRVFLAYPSMPSDHTPKGKNEFEQFHAAHEMDYRHSAAQISAYTAAMILVEGLKRAGRDLSRDRLMQELEGLSEFQSGLMPAISYNHTRRIGALGGYVVALDLGSRKLETTSRWIALDE